MVFVPSLSKFVYYSSALGDSAYRFGQFFLDMAATEFMIIAFLCSELIAEYGAAELFPRVRLWALTKDGPFHVSEMLLVLLPCKTRVNIPKHAIVRTITDCGADPVAASIAFACAGRIEWTMPIVFDAFLYD